MKIKVKTRIELDTIDLLKLLIKRWDEEQRPLSDADPVEFLQGAHEKQNELRKCIGAGGDGGN